MCYVMEIDLSSLFAQHVTEQRTQFAKELIQITYSWIARQLHIGTLLGRRHNYVCLISNPRPVLDSSAQTARGMLHT